MKLSKKFSRKIEDFGCGHCGHSNEGNGYTNHCSNCLWSKHVDINPGDRASDCNSLMAPVALEIKKDNYILTHECVECGHRKKNKTSPEDNMDRIIAVASGSYKYKEDSNYMKRSRSEPSKKQSFKHEQ